MDYSLVRNPACETSLREDENGKVTTLARAQPAEEEEDRRGRLEGMANKKRSVIQWIAIGSAILLAVAMARFSITIDGYEIASFSELTSQ